MIYHLLLVVETTLLLSVAALYIMHCPFNKVEESFNTQAVHDIINLFPSNLPSKVNLYDNKTHLEVASRAQLSWDHLQFPGVVPRTFVGAFAVGLPMKLANYFMSRGFLDEYDIKREEGPDLTSQFILQIGSRFALASFVVFSLTSISRAIHRRYGLTYRLCFSLITISQFHYMFYAGRFLPNTFATILANLVVASWINRQYSKSIVYVASCVVIFRFDTALFFGWLLLDGVFIRKIISFTRLLKIGVPAGLAALSISFTVDSIFWARPVWPEFESFYFNSWLNKSHEWGTQPFSWYIYSCLPRMLLASGPLILLADHKVTREYLLTTMAFILTYSFLPHKELRFILFVTPMFNISAVSGLLNIYYYINEACRFITRTKGANKKSILARITFSLLFAAILLVNIFGCFILSSISSHNYPGGQAAISLGMTKELLESAQKTIAKNVDLEDPRSDTGVYINNLAAQTGVSRFVQVNGAYYSKDPKLDENTFRNTYKLIYLVLEPREVVDFLKKNCPVEQNQEQFLNDWKGDSSEIRCDIPNQPQMYCSLTDSVRSLNSVDMGGLYNRFKQFASLDDISNFLIGTKFIKTHVALHIIRCSVRSKFNPFS